MKSTTTVSCPTSRNPSLSTNTYLEDDDGDSDWFAHLIMRDGETKVRDLSFRERSDVKLCDSHDGLVIQNLIGNGGSVLLGLIIVIVDVLLFEQVLKEREERKGLDTHKRERGEK